MTYFLRTFIINVYVAVVASSFGVLNSVNLSACRIILSRKGVIMGTICILLGLIIFIGSFFLGAALYNAYVVEIVSSLTSFPQGASVMAAFIGVCAFIGLLICLNLVMHGKTYNKICKLERKLKH